MTRVRPDVGVVDYTLWRNSVLLGRVRIPFDGSAIGGMLEVAPAFNDVADEIMQTKSPFGPPGVVSQNRKSERHHGPGPVALRPVSPEEAAGVPSDQVIELRDETGRTWVPTMLMIMRMPDDELLSRGELYELCVERGIAPSPWVLVADPERA